MSTLRFTPQKEIKESELYFPFAHRRVWLPCENSGGTSTARVSGLISSGSMHAKNVCTRAAVRHTAPVCRYQFATEDFSTGSAHFMKISAVSVVHRARRLKWLLAFVCWKTLRQICPLYMHSRAAWTPWGSVMDSVETGVEIPPVIFTQALRYCAPC